MNSEPIDILYRSRITLLDHLEDSGYDTSPYRKFSPKEIGEMIKAGPVNGSPPALQMELTRKTPTPGLPTKCLVVYTIGKIKQKLAAFTSKIVDTEEGNFNPETTEVIVITLEPIALNFGAMALNLYNTNKTRIRYFQAASIVNNPLKHMLQPKFEKVPAEEEEPLLKSMYAKKSQLPFIRFHEDMAARMNGFLPGDIIKITRPSLTSGECVLYRICVP
jgi:hypothetical protein